MAGADQPEPAPAEMTLDPVLNDVVRDLPQRSKERGAVREPTVLASIAPDTPGLGRGHPFRPAVRGAHPG